MNCLEHIAIDCPYCGERMTIVVDGSAGAQRYFEDCQVCCRPMDIIARISADGEFRVEARSENDIQ